MNGKFIIACFALAAASLTAQTPSEATSFGNWTVSPDNPIQGLSLRVRLVSVETADSSGSRTAVIYVEFQNTNNSVNTIYVHSYFDLKCELRDSSGNAVPPALWSYNGLIPELTWLALPFDSTLRCRPNPPARWKAKDGELLIGAGWGLWKIPRGDTNDHYLSGTLTLTIPKGETLPLPRHPKADGSIVTDNSVMPYVCKGVLNLPPVKIPAAKP